jgi:maltokinase
VTGWPNAVEAMDERQRAGIVRALGRWTEHHDEAAAERGTEDRGPGADVPPATVVDMEVLWGGRPGLLDVVAETGGRLAHAVFGLHGPGAELRVLGAVEEPALGVLEDAEGFVVVVDALHDADAAPLLLEAVAGDGVRGRPRGVVTLLHDGADAVTLGFDRRYMFTVFPWLSAGPHPGVAMLAGLDDAGFNHLPAPVAFWRRAGRDLGVVQEFVAGSAGGWALALTSLRDLFAAGVSPDMAGGDFAPESFALGTMTARMHLALERAFGRRDDEVGAWADLLAPVLAAQDGLDDRRAEQELNQLRATGLRLAAIRTHGDFHLGRTARTDHGWVVSDTMPGGADQASGDPVFRPPLADVADFLWSLRHAAAVAASERGPAAEVSRVGDLAESWSARNRRAFLAAYLAVPGIHGLVPTDRTAVRLLVSAFEAAREHRRPNWARAAG